MTVKSMTGFAALAGGADGVDWRWDVRSLNGRGLDMRLRLPPGTEDLEAKVRELVGRNVARGSCQLQLQFRRDGSAGELRINQAALSQAMALLAHVSEELGAAPPRADGVLALKGVMEYVEHEEDEDERKARQAAILADLAAALDELDQVRRGEGAELSRTLAAQLDEMVRVSGEIALLPARGREAQLERLHGQLERLLEARSDLSPERLHQEAALLATKGDIREELDRLLAHVEAARALMAADEPVGRRLDFLSQEFNREANTICSKSGDLDTTRLGLELKAVIDQFREQVQNVE
jgi:uncharacterized protein (TIGR00255 family)